MFTQRLPKDAHSIRSLQMGLNLPATGVMDTATQGAWSGRMYARTNAAKQAFADDAEAAIAPQAPQFAPTTAQTRMNAVASLSQPGGGGNMVGVVPAAGAAGGTGGTAPASGGVAPRQSVFGKAGSAVKSVAGTVAKNPMSALNVLQGVGGAISYATAKAPAALSAPAPYTSPIRGAEGMERTSYDQVRSDIRQGQSAASMGNTADVATNAVTQLLAQRQAGQALSTLAGQNNQAYQQDRARVNGEERADYGINYQNQQRFRENKFNNDQRQYEARRTQSAAMVQGAIDSMGAASQQRQQGQQIKQETINRKTEANVTMLHNSLSTAAPEDREALLEQLRLMDKDGTTYAAAKTKYGVKKGMYGIRLAGGGSLSVPTGVKFNTEKGSSSKSSSKSRTGSRGTAAMVPPSVTLAHKMSEEFGRHISAFSNQARQAFDRSMQTAIRLRSTPMGGSTSR